MLEAILATIYISGICWVYGSLFTLLFRGSSPAFLSFPVPVMITCFIGLAGIGILFTILSLVIPLGGTGCQLLLLLPAIYYFFRHGKTGLANMARMVKEIKECPALILVACGVCLLLLFVMHAHAINHPDTLSYHAQNIQWIEKYRAVPGIANLNYLYGIQSSWFVLSALFSFRFTGTGALSFANIAVLSWFIIFCMGRLAASVRSAEKSRWLEGFSWLLLLGFSFASYTQVRLTATSGSPDFIVVLYLWLILYLFLQHGRSGWRLHLLLCFLGLFAVTVKLSAVPILLLCFFSFYKYGHPKRILQLSSPFIMAFIVLAPFIARNIISSGYMLFPSTHPDLLAADWKVPADILKTVPDYITAYARTNAGSGSDEVNAAMKMQWSEWVPVWWKLRSFADQVLLVVLPLLFVMTLLSLRRIANRKNELILAAMVFLSAGAIFWFAQAPDPRFGYGFLLPLAGCCLYLLMDRIEEKAPVTRRWLALGIGMLAMALFSYTAYRFVYFFSLENAIRPAGLVQVTSRSMHCDGIEIQIPANEEGCGAADVPCTTDSCGFFLPRGKKVEDGFKPPVRNP